MAILAQGSALGRALPRGRAGAMPAPPDELRARLLALPYPEWSSQLQVVGEAARAELFALLSVDEIFAALMGMQDVNQKKT